MTAPSLAVAILPWVWFVAGFVGGCLATYLFGFKVVRDPYREPSMTSIGTPSAPTARKVRRFTLLHAIGLIVVALTIMSALQSWYQSRAAAQLTRCLTAYANANADAIDARSKANAEGQKASVDMWRTVFSLPQTDAGRAEARRVFQNYLDKQDAALKAQQEHPFPAAPRDVCPTPTG
jgi:hypothetical protein